MGIYLISWGRPQPKFIIYPWTREIPSHVYTSSTSQSPIYPDANKNSSDLQGNLPILFPSVQTNSDSPCAFLTLQRGIFASHLLPDTNTTNFILRRTQVKSPSSTETTYTMSTPGFAPLIQISLSRPQPSSIPTCFQRSPCLPNRLQSVLRPYRPARMVVASPPAASLAATLLATTADIGPFTNVNVESTGLVLAILGGVLVAVLVTTVIVRF